jgi:hypothetical protein
MDEFFFFFTSLELVIIQLISHSYPILTVIGTPQVVFVICDKSINYLI